MRGQSVRNVMPLGTNSSIESTRSTAAASVTGFLAIVIVAFGMRSAARSRSRDRPSFASSRPSTIPSPSIRKESTQIVRTRSRVAPSIVSLQGCLLLGAFGGCAGGLSSPGISGHVSVSVAGFLKASSLRRRKNVTPSPWTERAWKRRTVSGKKSRETRARSVVEYHCTRRVCARILRPVTWTIPGNHVQARVHSRRSLSGRRFTTPCAHCDRRTAFAPTT
jgi:hypothetical protein